MREVAPYKSKAVLDLHLKYLAALVTSSGEAPYVSMEKFGKFLGWFGPFDERPAGGSTIMQRVADVAKQSYFHGFLDTDEAKAILDGRQDETFLVRFSSSSPGSLTISKISSGVITHQRIHHPPNKEGYVINDSSYSSLLELILAERHSLSLSWACKGSKFYAMYKGMKESSEENIYL
eukprot:TRINITY_DN7109_c0_g2_i1.p1 TRINITY_DN7109_c0_g2~~TRINITY_DN7109_c0_g2_i1.p1  ORF type:complete len:178 (-),score=21.22 TRINITY_DN7109_c0_g2_i1:50-583(-)